MRRAARLHRARFVALIAAFLVACGIAPRFVAARQNAEPSATAVIIGRVINGSTRAAVPGAAVTLTVDPSSARRMPARQVLADALGRFVFAAVPDGAFRLSATRDGWDDARGSDAADRGFGLILPRGITVTLRQGQRVESTLTLWRNPVVSGHVLSESGEPLANARVGLARWSALVGRRIATGTSASTDDEGAFTISAAPGDYLLSASSDEVRTQGVTDTSGGQHFVFSPISYPASRTSDAATAITLAYGDDRQGLDLHLPLVRAWRVTGTLRADASGRVPQRLSLTALDENMPQRAVAVSPQGRFRFDNVSSGRYLLATLFSGVVSAGRGGRGNQNDQWVRAVIEVGSSDVEVTPDVHPSVHISGRVQFDGVSPPPDGAQTAGITLWRDNEYPTDVSPAAAPVGADGRFSVDVTPGRYIVTAGVRANIDPQALFAGSTARLVAPAAQAAARVWQLRSAISGGRDVADRPLVVTSDVSDLVVTFADREAQVQGRVAPLRGARDDGAAAPAVVLFPTDESLWVDYGPGRRIRIASVSAGGTYTLAAPAGDYYVASVQGARSNDLRQGALFHALVSRAKRVVLEEGVVASQDLDVQAAPAVRLA